MKSRVISHSVLKTLVLATTTAVLIAGFSLSSLANTIKETGKNANNNASSSYVQYVVSNEKSAEFHVEFENPTGDNFTLTIKNDEGDVVYSKDFSDVHFSRTIRILTEGDETHKIYPTFTITSGTKVIQRSFAVESANATSTVSSK